MNSIVKTVTVVMMGLSASACAGLGQTVTPLGAPYQCQPPATHPGARLLTTPLSGAEAFTLGNRAAPPDRVDHSLYWVLRVDMGERPTGGYGLALASDSMEMADGVARIVLNWVKPAPDAFVTQAFTSPCMLLQVPKGEYSRIDLVDSAGVIQHRVDVPGAGGGFK